MTDLIEDEETWVPSHEDFGARLAAVRWGMRWNIKEAALACGIPAQSWRQWELGEVLPRDQVSVARRICERTGVDLIWMITGSARRDAPVVHDIPTVRRIKHRDLNTGPGRKRVTEEYSRRPADGRPIGGPGMVTTPRRTVRVAA